MKKGIVKVGYTRNPETLHERYNTYYGANTNISYVKIDDAYNDEQAIHKCMSDKYENVGKELYVCPVTDAKHIVKEITGCVKMKKAM